MFTFVKPQETSTMWKICKPRPRRGLTGILLVLASGPIPSFGGSYQQPYPMGLYLFDGI